MAEFLDRSGYDVIVVDMSTRAFDRLPGSFGGTAVRGDGTDEDTLRRAGAEGADVFLAMTEGDNRNVIAAQPAVEGLGGKKVVAKVNDPLRASAYADLGLAVLCRTTLMGDAVRGYLGLPVSGVPGVYAPRGQHPGGAPRAGGAGAGSRAGSGGVAGASPWLGGPRAGGGPRHLRVPRSRRVAAA